MLKPTFDMLVTCMRGRKRREDITGNEATVKFSLPKPTIIRYVREPFNLALGIGFRISDYPIWIDRALDQAASVANVCIPKCGISRVSVRPHKFDLRT